MFEQITSGWWPWPRASRLWCSRSSGSMSTCLSCPPRCCTSWMRPCLTSWAFTPTARTTAPSWNCLRRSDWVVDVDSLALIPYRFLYVWKFRVGEVVVGNFVYLSETLKRILAVYNRCCRANQVSRPCSSLVDQDASVCLTWYKWDLFFSGQSVLRWHWQPLHWAAGRFATVSQQAGVHPGDLRSSDGIRCVPRRERALQWRPE